MEKRKKSKYARFVKQVGTYLAKQMGMSERHGGNFNEFPESIKFRQFPTPPCQL